MKDIISQVQNKGIFYYKNFLLKDEVNYIIHLLKNDICEKGDKKSYLVLTKKEIFIKLIKLQFPLIYKSFILKKISKEKKMKFITDEILQGTTSLKMIDFYKTVKNTGDVLPWHIDLAYSGKKNVLSSQLANPYLNKIKFIIYLTKAGPHNGSTSFIPESHKITLALREGLYFKKIKYKPHWNLRDLVAFVRENEGFLKDYFNSDAELNSFLGQTEICLNDNKTNEFDFEFEPGDAIIFDEGGVHRGSKSTLNDRIVLRYHFSLDDVKLKVNKNNFKF